MNETTTFRDKLIDVAGRMYMRLGLKSVSMDDVAREMGVSKKTIYQVVANKEELVTLVMECDFNQDIAELEKNSRESHDAIDEFLRNSRYHIRGMREISPATMYDLNKYYPKLWVSQIQGHRQHFQAMLRNNMERGMEEGLYRDDLDTDIYAQLCVAGVLALIDSSVFPATERPLSTIIYHHANYHLNGIVNQFGRERMEAYLKQEALE